jgi:Ca-activated chloride channel family protein
MKKLIIFGFSLLLISCSNEVVAPQNFESKAMEEAPQSAEMSIAMDTASVNHKMAMVKMRKASAPMMMAMPVQQSETYSKIEENGFKSTATDPLSTFSIDVDTASYSNIRRYLQNSSLPPVNAVRVEELVNYFDYGYRNSSKDIKIFSEVGEPLWSKKSRVLKVALKAKEIDRENLPSSNLVFLIDVSGSMGSPNKIELVKKSLKLLLKNLKESDSVAIVTYAGSSQTLLKSTKMTKRGYREAISIVEKLRAGGSTNGEGGIELAYREAKSGFIANGNNRVILFTDGDFNIGARTPDQLLKIAEENRKSGIYITVLGYGMGNYRDDMVEKLSNSGNGNYSYIDNILQAKKSLVNELSGNLYTIGSDVKIQVEFNPKFVKEYRLIGYENRKLENSDFTDDKKDAGEIGVGHTITALYEIVENSEKEQKLKYTSSELTEAGKSGEIATVKVRYKPKESDKSVELEHIVQNSASKNSAELNFALSVASFGMLLRDSKYIEDLKFDEILKIAKESRGADPDGIRSEFIKLIETAEILKSED